ncbi:unnamed protein product, partial [Ixodes persulcatus]
DTEVADTEVSDTEVADTVVVDTAEEGMDMAAAATEEVSGMDILFKSSLSFFSFFLFQPDSRVISAETKQLPSCRHQNVKEAYFCSRYLQRLLKKKQKTVC